MNDKIFYLGALILYIGVMIFIGFKAHNATHSLEDFYIGGRKIGVWVIAFAYVSTWNSAVTYVGFPGNAYKTGMAMVASGVLSAIFAGFVGWLLMAKRLRIQSTKLNSLTIPDYLESRYQSFPVRILSTIAILIFSGIYLVAQYAAVAYILQIYFGTSYLTSVIIMAVTIAIYTSVGGYLAVVWTDLIQGIIMTLVSVIIPIFCLILLGGWNEINVTVAEGVGQAYNEVPGLMGPLAFSYMAFYTLGSLGSPQLTTKFFSIKDKKVWKYGLLLITVVLALQTPMMAFSGIATRAAVLKGVMSGDMIAQNADYTMPALMTTIAPKILGVLYLVGVFGAAMSTADSLLLTSSSALVRDLFQKGLKMNLTDDRVKTLTSVFTVVITVVTAALSMLKLPMVVMISTMQLTVVGAAFMPSLICGIWWKKGTKGAAASSIAVGIIVPTLLFTVLKDANPFGHAFWPSLILSFLTYFIVSKFTKPLPSEFVDDLFKYKEWEESQEAWDTEPEPATAK
ncbi:MAG: sodium/solute symporter [Oscillospiraceae bacterium]|nr:sodium/solute symporter [Oscillospiraceae bacterium]